MPEPVVLLHEDTTATLTPFPSTAPLTFRQAMSRLITIFDADIITYAHRDVKWEIAAQMYGSRKTSLLPSEVAKAERDKATVAQRKKDMGVGSKPVKVLSQKKRRR